MALQSLNIGSVANDGSGDTLRAGGDKINDNFSEIYTTLGDGSTLSAAAPTNNPTFTGVVKFPDGSASTPSITNTDDANTGMFFGGADQVDISAGGTARLTVSTSALTSTVNVVIPNAGNIGSVGDTDAIAIASGGAVTFSQRDVHSSGITVADDGQIGSASDADAIAISAAGVTTFSQKDVHSVGLSVKNGSTSAGFIEFFENSGNGTNKVTLIGPASTSDVTLTLGSTAGTIATTADIAGEATALAIALG